MPDGPPTRSSPRARDARRRSSERAPGPAGWEEGVRRELRRLEHLPVALHLELGLHPATHACAACTAARRVRDIGSELGLPLVWREVAPVLPGQEGVAAPPPWLRVLLPGSEDGPVRFLGPVRGDLLDGLVRVLEDVAAPVPPPMEAWKEVLPRLHRRHFFRVFTAARCSDGPPVIRSLARLVHTAPARLALDVLDAETFPQLARRFGVRTLPTVTIDNFAHFYGPPDERHLANAIEDVLPSGGFPYIGPRGESPFGSF